MKKIMITLLSIVSFAYCSGGCILTQPKTLNVSYSSYDNVLKANINKKFTNIKYIPTSLEGTNFKELFVGSKIMIDTTSTNLKRPNIKAEITDIKANKRIKGKPRTGNLTIQVTVDKEVSIIPMTYYYNNGYFRAVGMLDKDVILSFNTTIKAVLCEVKVDK
ncbi:MAG: hypothetical protein KAQ94_05755 [Arcobacteraceae bacterium]|nr:hypothetical protein [Arcobacteraceae bacterium]